LILWRISAYPDLKGVGGLLASGRWHHAGRPVVYLAESPASAMLEVLVHLEVDAEDVPSNLRLIRVELPDVVAIASQPSLPADWEDQPAITQDKGDAWFDAGETLLLPVPSAIMPHTTNYLLNPHHPESSRVTASVETLKLDSRLFKGLNRE
jgi:RES domain-containing protein